jgi:hypothetical protein
MFLATCAFLLIWLSACRKESIITGQDAGISISADTLHFDTVFTTAGSVTGSIKIYNLNEKRIRLSSIRLRGGSGSFFSMNVDGIAGSEVRSVEIGARDSLYVFVTVRIDPGNDSLPFLVRDSISIGDGRNEKWLQLEAYGQNAKFIRNGVIDADARLSKGLPYVILGGLVVRKDRKLTIDKGVRLFMHADAPIVIDGTLEVIGTATEPVVFTGDRLDEGYRELPASWPGIFFRSSSRNNVLKYAIVQHAYQGLVADQPSPDGSLKLSLEGCTIRNIYEGGIIGIRSSIQAVNSLIANCGNNVVLTQGGQYHFTHCTLASYSNFYVQHKNPVLSMDNWDSTASGVRSFPLEVRFQNNIIWADEGVVDNEVSVSRRGSEPFLVSLDHNLFRGKTDPLFSSLSGNIRNQDPRFDSINASKRYFDFRLQKGVSPAIDKGIKSGIPKDLDGFNRDVNPDIGCYEKH